jgi:hypothetical protein
MAQRDVTTQWIKSDETDALLFSHFLLARPLCGTDRIVGKIRAPEHELTKESSLRVQRLVVGNMALDNSSACVRRTALWQVFTRFFPGSQPRSELFCRHCLIA